MVGHFPSPYPDELLYSAIARGATRLGIHSAKLFVEDLFGGAHVRATVNFTGRLEMLVSNLPPRLPLTPGEAIDNHCMFPWVAPFLPPTRAAELRRRMIASDGRSFDFLAGFMQSGLKRRALFYSCPSCDAEDMNLRGEHYWHRLFQIPGVTICPRHAVFLQPSLVPRPEGRLIQRFIAANAAGLNRIVMPANLADRGDQDSLRIAQHTQWLINHCPSPPGVNALRHAYLSRLGQRGFVAGSGRIEQQSLRNAFRKRFSSSWLDGLQCSLAAADQEDWLSRLLRREESATSPLRHLIMLIFLDWSPAELFSAAIVTIQPSIPQKCWPCLNLICPEAGKPSINDVKWKFSPEHSEKVFTVRCPACGYTYCSGLVLKRRLVLDHGTRWRRLLRKRWLDQRRSLRNIAREFKSDPMTIKRHAAALGLPFPRQSSRPTRSKPVALGFHRACRREALRMQWQGARSANPCTGRLRLRKRFPALYAALYRCDHDWLMSHQPRRRKRRNVRSAVDWKARDCSLRSRVQKAVEPILAQSAPAKHATVTAICSALGAPWLARHRRKLPKSWKAIQAASESRMAFAVRRIRLAAERLAAMGQPLDSWRLQRTAGLRPEVTSMPAVADELRRWCGRAEATAD